MGNRFSYREQYDDSPREDYERAAVEITNEEHPRDAVTVQQQFKDDVDLNVMAARMGVKDGSITPQAYDPRYFGDFTDAVDFREAMNRVSDANFKFQMLPAAIKNRFNNDPTELFHFIADEKNKDEALRLGLLKEHKPEPEQIPTVRIAKDEA